MGRKHRKVCDKCGAALGKPRYRLALQKEYTICGDWTSAGGALYLCRQCLEDLVSSVDIDLDIKE